MSSLTRRSLVAVCAFVASAVLAGAFRPATAQSEGQAAQRKGKFEVYQGRAGDFRWRLKSPNGQVIATGGQGYKDKRDCRNAIDSVKRLAADAPVEEVTQPAEEAGAPNAAAPDAAAGERPTRKGPTR
jgi:uncharacterized protein YegP (UPF0339 family)